MSAPAETLVQPMRSSGEIILEPGNDRRSDIDAKHTKLATLLQETGSEGLLVLDADNFTWLTSGATNRGIFDEQEMPVLYFSAEQRWVICSNTDTQRVFDEELDGLGFLLKEWPWHWGREQLLSDLCQGRQMACDRPYRDYTVVDEQLRGLRRALTRYEQACFRALGGVVSHALEATCRTMEAGAMEREVAGQVSHRLIHRGVQPVLVGVAADGRSRTYRQYGFTPTPLRKYGVLVATGRKYGLHATASRAVSFGALDPLFRQEHDACCKVSATYIASSWPDAMPRQVLQAGRRIYQITGFEHEWLLCPQGHATGRAAVEVALTPTTEELFQDGWAVTWRASAGAASSCDTYLITDQGPQAITPTEVWPLKRIRVQGADFMRPDILQR